MSLQEMFDAIYELPYAEHPKFDDIQNKRSTSADLHAFLLLQELCPCECNIISGAEHDRFYIATDVSLLQETITQEQVNELFACGIMYDSDACCLSKYA